MKCPNCNRDEARYGWSTIRRTGDAGYWFECTNCGYVGWGTEFETDEERAAEKIREEQPYIRKVSQH